MLDNIIDYEMKGYIKANDGKYYKYNYEINNIYYCPDNIIIDNLEVKKLEKENYILLDYFILDKKNKIIQLYDEKIEDSFVNTIENIENIEVKEEKCKKIIIKSKNNKNIEIKLDNLNNIIEINNPVVEEIKDNFLIFNNKIRKVYFENAKIVGDNFLMGVDFSLKIVEMPNVIIIKDNFIKNANSIRIVNLKNTEEIGEKFLFKQMDDMRINIEKVKKIGKGFLFSNLFQKELIIPETTEIGDCFMYGNVKLKLLNVENLKYVGKEFLVLHQEPLLIISNNIENIGENFIPRNEYINREHILKK